MEFSSSSDQLDDSTVMASEREVGRAPAPTFERRGRLLGLASSCPDLIEVDLKPPGFVEGMLPLFTTATKQKSLDFLRMILYSRGIESARRRFSGLGASLPFFSR
jgi:hypothetical protein